MILQCKDSFDSEESFERGRRHLFSQILCFGRHTISGLLRNQDRIQQDWTADYRFYSEDRFDEDKLFNQVRCEIEKYSPNNAPLVVAMDDSILRKTGRKIHGSRYQRDPVSPAFHCNLARGLRVLQISAVVPQGSEGDGRLVPVDFQHAALPAKPRKNAPAQQHADYQVERAKKNINVAGHKRLTHVRQQMDQSGSASRGLIVTIDGRFTNATVLRNIPERTVLIGRVRKDSVFYHPPEVQPAHGRRKKYGLRCPTPEELLKDQTVPWQSVKAFAAGKRYEFKIKTIASVLTQMNKGENPLRLLVIEPVPYRLNKNSKLERREPAYLICTDPNLSLEQVVQMYLWRWDIEVNFRDEKTILGVGQAQVRSETSNQNAPALAVAAYSLLLLASMKVYGTNGKPDIMKTPLWQKQKPAQRATTNDLINQLRSEMWSDSLKKKHFSPFSSQPTPDQNGLKCDHPLHSAIFLSIK